MVSDTKQYRPSARRHAEIVGKLTRRIDELKAEAARANTGAEWSGAEFERVSAELVKEKTFSDMYQKDAARFTALLSRISGTLSDCCMWDDLPTEINKLYQRCNQYGERVDRLGEANTALQTELKRTSEILASLTKQCDTLQAEKRHAEGRYIALSRQRSIEWGIIILAFIGGLVAFGAVVIFGGDK
jgi:predicted RNase H-like nuclease (RuvC/YqgF family)